MMKRILFLSLLAAVLFWTCGTGTSESEQSESEEVDTTATAEEAAPKAPTQLIFENEYTKIVKVSLEPGETQPLHEAPERLVYSLSDYTIDWSEEGVNMGVKEWKKGDVHYHGAGEHSARNVGETIAEWVVFQYKAGDLPPCGDNTTSEDIASLPGDFARVLFENDLFKVNLATVEPGQSVPIHAGVNRVIFALSDFTMEYTREGEEDDIHDFQMGEARWQDACRHSSKNVGDTKAEFLVVAY